MPLDVEAMRPTRGYRVHMYDATVIDLHAEAMWSRGNALEWTVTALVIGLPREVVVQRCARAEVDLVVRDDLAVWPPRAAAPSAQVSSGRSEITR